jgi:hypothetical protein
VQEKEPPPYVNLNGYRHVAIHFGRKVEVFSTPHEYWCVVHHPEKSILTAGWRMPKELNLHQAAAIAASKTRETDYVLGWPVQHPTKAS